MKTPGLIVVGIAGGIACGKSEVAGRLVELGAVPLDADRAGHEALEAADVRAALRARWGGDVFRVDGSVDRQAVAARVFVSADTAGDRSAVEADRKFLEQWTHPRIERILERRLREEIERSGGGSSPRVAVLDAALLLEAGWDRFCDEIWFVESPESSRRERAAARGWTEDEWRAREAAQWPLADKRRRAQRILENTGSKSALREQVDAWWVRRVGSEPAPTAGSR
ncbi:MAG: dephospho-CoA kinase [Planctomycetes bacterium]|nr:dephospho-CoA kinase [Planctomycetota bacterium]